MYEFKKIKLIRPGEKKTIITEASKKQRELFEKFNIDYPVKPSYKKCGILGYAGRGKRDD